MAEAKKKNVAQAEAGNKNHSSAIVENLLSKGTKNGGTLTYGELVEALQQEDLTPDEIDRMYDTFSQQGIEIVDDSSTTDVGDDDIDMDDKDAEEVEIDLSVPEGISIDDPVSQRVGEKLREIWSEFAYNGTLPWKKFKPGGEIKGID